MARMNSLERLGAALAEAQSQPASSPSRAPGDATTTPVSGTPRYDLLMRLGVPSLPPDSRLPDSLVADLLTMPDAPTTKDKFRALFCVPPGPFYCEDERTTWMNENPWCAGATIPLVTVPTFTSDVERNAFIATHQHCPTPPPVLTNHLCTPGDPGCAPITPSSSSPPASASANNGMGTFAMGAAAVAFVWWFTSLDKPRGNPASRYSADPRYAGDERYRVLAADRNHPNGTMMTVASHWDLDVAKDTARKIAKRNHVPVDVLDYTAKKNVFRIDGRTAVDKAYETAAMRAQKASNNAAFEETKSSHRAAEAAHRAAEAAARRAGQSSDVMVWHQDRAAQHDRYSMRG